MRKIIIRAGAVLGMLAIPTLVSAAVPRNVVGRILLQVEARGEAWYVSPVTETRTYLQNGESAYALLRSAGLGISAADLAKIPIGIETRFVEADGDNDGLSDSLEQAIGSDPADSDSDNDGFLDGAEVRSGYSATVAGAPGKVAVDAALAARISGRILLDVGSHGEAWYLHPVDKKRYYMKDGAAAYAIMRYLGLGISNVNLATLPVASSGDTPVATPTTTPAPTPAPAPAPIVNATADIANFAFQPATITIKVGAKVTWTNKDSAPHTVTADDKSFDSGLMAAGSNATFSHTFTKAGTYTYYCDFHRSMRGTVIVQ